MDADSNRKMSALVCRAKASSRPVIVKIVGDSGAIALDTEGFPVVTIKTITDVVRQHRQGRYKISDAVEKISREARAARFALAKDKQRRRYADERRKAKHNVRVELAAGALIQRIKTELRAKRYGVVNVTLLEPKNSLQAVAQAASRLGEHYSSRCTWRKTYCDLRLDVPRDWIRSVEAEGIAYAHGIVTLAAKRIRSRTALAEGDRLWDAVWTYKGTGHELVTERGVLMVRGADIVHGRNRDDAIRLMSSRRSAASIAHNIMRSGRRRVLQAPQKLKALVDTHGDVVVTIADSIKAGNCNAGTAAWIARHLPKQETATIREIVSVCAQKDYRLILAACLQAVKRELAISIRYDFINVQDRNVA